MRLSARLRAEDPTSRSPNPSGPGPTRGSYRARAGEHAPGCGRQEALRENLSGGGGGVGEKGTDNEAGPECVFGGEIPRKIVNPKLVPGCGRPLRYLAPTAGNTVQ